MSSKNPTGRSEEFLEKLRVSHELDAYWSEHFREAIDKAKAKAAFEEEIKEAVLDATPYGTF